MYMQIYLKFLLNKQIFNLIYYLFYVLIFLSQNIGLNKLKLIIKIKKSFRTKLI